MICHEAIVLVVFSDAHDSEKIWPNQCLKVEKANEKWQRLKIVYFFSGNVIYQCRNEKCLTPFATNFDLISRNFRNGFK